MADHRKWPDTLKFLLTTQPNNQYPRTLFGTHVLAGQFATPGKREQEIQPTTESLTNTSQAASGGGSKSTTPFVPIIGKNTGIDTASNEVCGDWLYEFGTWCALLSQW